MKKKIERRTIVQCGIGFLTARVTFGGFNPVGMAYFASCFVEKQMRFPLFVSMLAGMMTSLEPVSTLRYAAVMGLLFLTESVAGRKKWRMRRREAAWMAGGGTLLLAGAQYLFTSYQIETVAYMLVECVLVVGLTHVFGEVVQYILYSYQGQALDNEEMVSLVILLTLAVYGLPGEAVQGFFVVRCAIYFLLLYMGYCYGAGTGALIGASCGLLTCLTGGDNTDLGILCLLGICAGSFRGTSKQLLSIAYIVTNLVLGYLFDNHFVGIESIREMVAACIFFVCLPGAALTQADLSVYSAKDGFYYQRKLQARVQQKARCVGNAFTSLAKNFRGNEPAYSVTPEGSVLPRIEFENRMRETRDIVAGQFAEVADIVHGMAEELCDMECLEQVEGQDLSRSLMRHNMQVRKCEILRHKNGRVEVFVKGRAERRSCVTAREIANAISEVVKVKMRPADDMRTIIPKEYEMLRFVESVNFKVLQGVARTVKHGEKISGDNYSFMDLAGEKRLMLLSDGMGSGDRACMESENVVELVEDFMEAGFREDSAIRLINSMLVLGQDRQGFATIDMSIVDLHTGICRFVKNGASATFIKHKDETSIVCGEALPVGMLPDVNSAVASAKLYDGEFVVMVTDGVLDALQCENKEETLAAIIDSMTTNHAQEMAEEILKQVLLIGKEAADDMTILVFGIWNL